ncbi:MAG: hypothetical protein NC081_04500 [Roseburia sp.]|nr:hypothetical protein [Roseburia sp.]
MTRQESIFFLVLFINFVITLLYFVYGMVWGRKKEGRMQYVMNAVAMLLCPVVAPLFFILGQLLFRFVLKEPVDLADVIFNKDKKESIVKADEEREMNIAPIEEALAVSDKSSLRRLMLNVIKGDITTSLRAISMALGSEDSETSHYAASVLVDELNSFRINVQKLYVEMKDEEGQNDTEERCAYASALIESMNPILMQNVLTRMEQTDYVWKMDEACQLLYELQPSLMRADYYEAICMRLLDSREYERCGEWCDRAMENYPMELSSHTCRLKLYFTAGDRERFFEALQQTKQSDVVIDKETLELIRIFQP